jgi:large subunit ribosomal protein L10
VDRTEKQQLITSLHETLKKAELVVITQQTGLTVAEVTNLRRQMRQLATR